MAAMTAIDPTPTPPPEPAHDVRVLIVAEHASARFGGEAVLPLHYFRLLLGLGQPVWLVTHARVRGELTALFPEAGDRIQYVEDHTLHKVMDRLSAYLPARLSNMTLGFVSRLHTQLAQRRLARKLIARHGIQVVHQPMPVSPKEPSVLHGLGVPVVIGPMNGGMTYPRAFRSRSEWALHAVEATGRAASGLLNRLLPGKRRAALLLAANERTQAALPATQGQVALLVENAVDMGLWQPPPPRAPGGATHFVFMGRLVDFKAPGVAVAAFIDAARQAPMTLTVLGDGPLGEALRAQAEAAGVRATAPGQVGKVWFAGWLPQAECAARLREADALLLPSLRECGGAVVLEAMACGLPTVVAAWGGPLDYVTPECGVLVAPDDAATLHSGFVAAMVKLAQEPAWRVELGRAGHQRVQTHFNWDRKIEVMRAHYRQVVSSPA